MRRCGEGGGGQMQNGKVGRNQGKGTHHTGRMVPPEKRDANAEMSMKRRNNELPLNGLEGVTTWGNKWSLSQEEEGRGTVGVGRANAGTHKYRRQGINVNVNQPNQVKYNGRGQKWATMHECLSTKDTRMGQRGEDGGGCWNGEFYNFRNNEMKNAKMCMKCSKWHVQITI